MIRPVQPAIVLFLVTGLGMASVPKTSVNHGLINKHERQIWKTTIHDSEIGDLPHAAIRPPCELTHPPPALTTPDPLLGATESGTKVTVSFIVSTDGTVVSPFILESSGSYEDQSVLQAVRAWRYRPATCNGVPMEAEGRIEFS